MSTIINVTKTFQHKKFKIFSSNMTNLIGESLSHFGHVSTKTYITSSLNEIQHKLQRKYKKEKLTIVLYNFEDTNCFC